MRNKTRTKRKLEDLDRYIAPCKYCNQDVSSQQSFVALVKSLNPISHNYAHYDCMKADDERRNNGTERSSYQTTSG
jgi:hypothetical protein